MSTSEEEEVLVTDHPPSVRKNRSLVRCASSIHGTRDNERDTCRADDSKTVLKIP